MSQTTGNSQLPAHPRRFRIGLQIKTALILTCVVSGVVALGAFSYYRAVHDMMRRKDFNHAVQLGKAFGVAAESALHDGDDRNLRRLVHDWVKGNVVYVAILDRTGDVAACYGELRFWHGRMDKHPRTLSHTYHGTSHILIARPIVARDKVWLHDRLAGGVRAVVDTHPTTRALVHARKRIIITAGCIELIALPVAYLLIWRVVLRPFRKLTHVTRKLADGNYSVRTHMKGYDEAGELGAAFDQMAAKVASMRFALLRQQDQLEKTVETRTRELQQANDRLCDEMRDKEEFLRAVSHDLNAPMRNIAGMATMIVMKHRDELPEDALARLQRIQSNVDQQSALIDELLEISRIKSRSDAPTKTDISRLLRELAETFEYELQQHNITLKIDESMPVVWVEKRRLRQAFQNLIDNAVKYMHRAEGGKIEVRHRFDGMTHEFVVWDNGPGIPPDQKEAIFTVFRRGYNTGEANVQGKGVGLTVVRTIASRYDGRAWVESSPQTGTSFHITLSDARVQSPHEEVTHV